MAHPTADDHRLPNCPQRLTAISVGPGVTDIGLTCTTPSWLCFESDRKRPFRCAWAPPRCTLARMTLLVALRGKDGIVLAADSRGTFGDPRGVTAQNDTMPKAHVVAPHSGVLIAGSGEVGGLLVHEFQDLYESGADHPTSVTDALRGHARQRYQEWFPSLPQVPPMALVQSGQIAARPDLVFIIGGIDPTSSDSFIYQLGSGTDFSPMLHNYGFAVAGVAQYALYLLNRLYQPDRSIDELVALAVYVITETASQDGKVGGPVSVIKITPSGGCVTLDSTEVQAVVDANEQRSENLRNSFYNGE